MSLFLNLLALIAFVFISIWIFTPKFDKYRLLKFPENRDYLYRINRNMYFLIFVVCTAALFFRTVFIDQIWYLFFSFNLSFNFREN